MSEAQAMRQNGVFLAFVSIALSSLSYPLLKTAMEGQDAVSVGFWECLVSVLVYGVVLLRQHERNAISGWLLAVGLVNGIGCVFLYMSLDTLHPLEVGLLSRNQYFFSLLLAFLILKERFSVLHILAVVLLLSGTYAFSYKGHFVTASWGAIYALLFCFSFALASLLVKKYLPATRVSLIVFVSRALSLGFIFLYVCFSTGHHSLVISIRGLLITSISSLCTVYFGYQLFLEAMKYTRYSTVNLIRALGPLFVALYSLPFFPMRLSWLNLAGGLVAIASSALLLYAERKSLATRATR